MFPIEEDLKKSVVMIAQPSPDYDFTPNLEDTYSAKPIGTGVLVGYKDISFCVTARHVIFNKKHPVINPIILTNNKDPKIPPKGRFSTQLHELGFGWVPHPNSEIDLAATKIKVNSYEDCLAVYEDRYRFFDELIEGCEVFIFGFPSSFSPRHVVKPLIRQGCIGLKIPKRIVLKKEPFPEKTILLDATVTPGNSGSPVFTKPYIIPKPGGLQVIQSRLCGIVSGHHCNVVKDFNGEPIGLENAGIGIISSLDQLFPLLDTIIDEQ